MKTDMNTPNDKTELKLNVINQCLDEIANILDVDFNGCRSGMLASVSCVFNAGYKEGLKVNKPSETPMSKDEPMKSTNPLPSSTTDKCKEEFVKYTSPTNNINHFSKSDLWNASWQASRKECDEENVRLKQELDHELGLIKQIASLQSLVEEKNEALDRGLNIFCICSGNDNKPNYDYLIGLFKAALHIDQSGDLQAKERVK